MYAIGEKPGIGSYRDEVGHTITPNDPDDGLPPCSRCGRNQTTTWTRVP